MNLYVLGGIHTIQLFDTTDHKVHFGGDVYDWEPEKWPAAFIEKPDSFTEKKEIKRLDRFSQLALASAQQAWEDGNLGAAHLDLVVDFGEAGDVPGQARKADRLMVNITGGADLSLSEASEATALITKVADPDANVIYGIVTDEAMGDAVKVTVIATGFTRGKHGKAAPTPVDWTPAIAAFPPRI